jgi:hypothetical protein
MTYYEILELEGLRAFFTNFDGYYAKYFTQFASGPEALLSWGSIASTCFDLARKIGSNPIIFVGQDLSYSDFLYHCPGSRFDDGYTSYLESADRRYLYTSYQSFHIQRLLEYNIFPEPDIYGKTVFCQKNHRLYAKWFHDEFARSSQLIINASERGIVRENCRQMRFKDVCEQILTRELPIEQKLAELYNRPSDYNYQALLTDIDSKLNTLNEAGKTAKKLQQECEDLLQSKDEVETDSGKVKVRNSFNLLTSQSNCGIEDKFILDWIDHENQKAEMFFKREIGKLVGQVLSAELIETTANFYYNFMESRFSCFENLGAHLMVAKEGCLNSMGEKWEQTAS